MSDLANRFKENPILSPKDLIPSQPQLEITCLLNPGVFEFDGKTWLIVRVAERPEQVEDFVSFPILNNGETDIVTIRTDDPEYKMIDARIVTYKGQDYLTTLSHLRLVCSDDGVHFYEPEGYPKLTGEGELENYGIEDCRVVKIEDTYYLTFTSVSDKGVGVGLRTTKDWKNFEIHGMILPPHNKDVAIFPEKINGLMYALHRPSGIDIGGNYIWIASSTDGLNWGNHKCLLKTRKDKWDSARVGAGASPIKTSKGWLEIYHGANHNHHYCLGAILLDLSDPSIILAQSDGPIMEPTEQYETSGFFGNVVFTNGHLVSDDGKTLTIYYGAADEFVCAAEFSIDDILSKLIYSHD